MKTLERDKAGNIKRYNAAGRYIPANAGKQGRAAGTPNKITRDLRAMILGALEAADKKGGQEYLRKRALDQPVAFMALLGKVLPTQITGAGGGPIRLADEASLAKLTPSELEKLTLSLIQIGFTVANPNE